MTESAALDLCHQKNPKKTPRRREYERGKLPFLLKTQPCTAYEEEEEIAALETMLFCVSATRNNKGTASRPHEHVMLTGRIHEALVFTTDAVATVLVLLVPTLVPNLVTFPFFPSPFLASSYGDDVGTNTGPGSSGCTFYDDTEVLYTTRWDARRAEWLHLHHPRRLMPAAAAA